MRRRVISAGGIERMPRAIGREPLIIPEVPQFPSRGIREGREEIERRRALMEAKKEAMEKSRECLRECYKECETRCAPPPTME